MSEVCADARVRTSMLYLEHKDCSTVQSTSATRAAGESLNSAMSLHSHFVRCINEHCSALTCPTKVSTPGSGRTKVQRTAKPEDLSIRVANGAGRAES